MVTTNQKPTIDTQNQKSKNTGILQNKIMKPQWEKRRIKKQEKTYKDNWKISNKMAESTYPSKITLNVSVLGIPWWSSG